MPLQLVRRNMLTLEKSPSHTHKQASTSFSGDSGKALRSYTCICRMCPSAHGSPVIHLHLGAVGRVEKKIPLGLEIQEACHTARVTTYCKIKRKIPLIHQNTFSSQTETKQGGRGERKREVWEHSDRKGKGEIAISRLTF